MDLSPLVYWVKERETVRLKKADGQLFPWTKDPILQSYRFCNVRREDDRVTIWIRKHIREPFADHPNLWLMLCIARQINWPDTLAYLINSKAWPSTNSFHPSQITQILNILKSRGQKVYTGAYMISAPKDKGADKQAYIAELVIGGLWMRSHSFRPEYWPTRTLLSTHRLIRETTGWGHFMAYQAVVDMRFTKLLDHAKDRDCWAAAGPGTIRGLNRINNRSVDQPLSQSRALDEMLSIYDTIQDQTGIQMDFSDVPNILCETDKYLRVKLGEGKPRALYVPGRGS